MDFLTILAFIGVVVTGYAIHVEKRANDFIKRNEQEIKEKKKKREEFIKEAMSKGIYASLCDISENASCSLVLTSEYAKLTQLFFKLSKDHPLNLPNTYYGLMFYVAVILYSSWPFTLFPLREYFLFGAALMSMLTSLLLAYIMKFKLHNVCYVCIMTWALNFGILAIAYNQL